MFVILSHQSHWFYGYSVFIMNSILVPAILNQLSAILKWSSLNLQHTAASSLDGLRFSRDWLESVNVSGRVVDDDKNKRGS